MSAAITFKSVTLSIVYVILVIGLLFLLNLGLEYFFNNIVFSLMDWFNSLKTWFKIFLLVVGASTILTLLFAIANIAAALLNGLLLSWFPLSVFNVIASYILAIANAIFSIVVLWKVPKSYNFWIVVELLVLSVFVWSINSIVVMRKPPVKN